MRREVDRLSAMLDDLFDLSRLDAGAFALDRRPIPIEDVVADVVDGMQFQAARQAVSLRITIANGLPVLSLDGARMARGASNLVRNALQHTPACGSIEVTLDRVLGDVRLEVRDSGEGIPAHDLERIWQRFYRGDRSRHRGTGGDGGYGLGLAIVKGIVEAHGGTVAVTSQRGRGSTFTVRLPIAEPTATPRRGGNTGAPGQP